MKYHISKIKFFTRNKKFNTLTLLVYLIFSIYILNKNLYLSHHVSLIMKTEHNSAIQVYYDTGKGFNEEESKKVSFDFQAKEYKFKLPNKKIVEIRIDPDENETKINIHSLQINNRLFSKKYTFDEMKNNVKATNNLFFDVEHTGFIKGSDPQIVFNDFIGRDFSVSIHYKLLFLSIILLGGLGLRLFFATRLYKNILKKFNTFMEDINQNSAIRSFHFRYRFDIYIYVAFFLIIIFSGLHDFLISISSLIYGLKFTIVSFLLSFVGLFILSFFPKNYLDNIIRKPFHGLFLGQLLLYFYIYVRSSFNEYVFFIPLSIFDLLIIILTIWSIMLYKKGTKEHLMNYYAVNKKEILIYFGLFFLIITGIAESELPRTMMLSTDPDQHAFFGKQIERFSTIPYHQFYWGSESFNYPAGTGVLGYIWSTLTFSDIRDALHIQPLLQLTITIFIIVEISNYDLTEVKKYFIFVSVLVIVSTYFMGYTFDRNHFHFEGTGRLMSISLVAFIMSFFIYSIHTRHDNNTSGGTILYMFLIALIVFYSITLNPVNMFYSVTLLGISYLIYFSKNVKFYIFIPLFLMLFTVIVLDPYYLNTLIYNSHNNIVDTVDQKIFSLSLDQFLSQTFDEIQNKVYSIDKFFSIFFFDDSKILLFICLVLISTIFYFHVTKRKSDNYYIFYSTLLFFLIIYLVWLFIGSVLHVLSDSATAYRLFYPYFVFNTMQYVYVVILLLIVFALDRIITFELTLKRIFLLTIVTTFVAIGLQLYFDTAHHTKRVKYANNISIDDIYIIEYIENFSKNIAFDGKIPKILVLNTMPIMGNEKWLFPIGASRLLPFYDTLPLAFYYFKGEKYFTYENYSKFVCNDFNVEWLKAHKIQYLFLPTDKSGCINDVDNILKNYDIVEQRNNSYFIKLYEK